MKPYVFAFVLTAIANMAVAAEDYPTRPIHFIVPNEAGGTTDVLIRALAPSLTKTLGQSIIVENRAGASATIGTSAVARAKADGYTLLVGSSATTSSTFVMKNLPYDARTELEPISRIAVTPYFLLINPTVKADNVRQLVALGKAQPGQLTYASSGSGTSPHLSGARFGDSQGLQLLHVPYKGTAPALNDLLAGRVDMMFVGLPSAAAQIKAGKLKAIAVAADQRLESAADVPTMKEAGAGDFTANSWFGILAPKGTPPAVKVRLAAALQQAVQEPQVKAIFENLGAVPLSETPVQAQQFYQGDLAFWEGVVSKFKGQLE